MRLPIAQSDSSRSRHVNSLYIHLKNSIKNNVVRPPKTVVADESIAQYKGKHSGRVCIKYKPNPYGFRHVPLCHRLGYCFSFLLDFGLSSYQIGNLNATSSCLQLMRDLRAFDNTPERFTLITDRYYSTVG